MMGEVEALLFVVGSDGISLDELGFILEASTGIVYQEITNLMRKYQADSDCAIQIIESAGKFSLTTKPEYEATLTRFVASPTANRLSQAALEVLAIIGYKQPITRVEIDEIRGVQSANALQKLVTRQLVEEKGRVDGPGRAILYGTTTYFMTYFGLKTLDDLPAIDQMEAEIEAELPSDLFFADFKELLPIDSADKGSADTLESE